MSFNSKYFANEFVPLLPRLTQRIFIITLYRKKWYNIIVCPKLKGDFMTTHSLATLSDTNPTRLTPNGTHSGMDITIQNVDETAIVYLGGEGVSSENYGFRLRPSEVFSIELPGTDSLYAISSIDESKIATITFTLEQGE